MLEARQHRHAIASTAGLAVGLPAGAALLGALTVALARDGAAARPWLAALVVLVGAAAALLPLRYGLPVALVLASFNGLLIDFVGDRATYWNEAFIAVLAVRAVVARRPSKLELIIAAGIVAAFCIYLVESSPREVFWGAKILLASVVAGWAVVRLRPERIVFRSVYCALTVAVGANVILAAWQRRQGFGGLHRLGVTDLDRVKQSTSGVLRAFGGFTSPAPFSYYLALTVLAFAALLLAGEPGERRLAVLTAWIPPVAVVGMIWSRDRTALVALVIALVVVALITVARPAAAVALLAVLAVTIPGYLSAPDPVPGTHITTASRQFRGRIALWRAYMAEAALAGHGPAAAGAAYERIHGRPPLPVALVDWRFQYTRWGIPIYEVGFPATIILRTPTTRPAAILGRARAYLRPRHLTVTVGRRTAASQLLGTSYRPLHVPIAPQRGTRVITVDAGRRPSAAPDRNYLLSTQIEQMRFEGLPGTPAEHAYERFLSPSVRPGVVDNQYVAWIFDFGLVGVGLCLVWIGVLLSPMFARARGPALVAARLTGVFLLVGAVAVDIWEEAPTDLVAAVFFALAVASVRPRVAQRDG